MKLARVGGIRRSRAFLGLATPLLSLFVVPVPARAQRVELREIGRQVAQSIRRERLDDSRKSRVLLAAFANESGPTTELGVYFRSEVATALTQADASLELVNEEQIEAVLQAQQMETLNLTDPDETAWAARLCGADAVVTGRYQIGADKIALWVTTYSLPSGHKGGQVMMRLPRKFDFDALEKRPYSSEIRVLKTWIDPPSNLVTIDEALLGEVAEPGKDGVGQPTCNFCPLPIFTDEAVKKEAKGAVVLRFIVTREGRAANIQVIKGLEFGLSDRAVEQVRKWRFVPAQKADGTVVAARITIEVYFRQP